MAKFKFDYDGFDEALKKIHQYETNASGLFKRSVFDGAEVMYQAIRNATEALKVGKGGNVTEVQKQGLLDGLGITTIRLKNGEWSNRIGFDGYNADGQPNPLIANVVNSGTSKYPKTRFVDKAVKEATQRCRDAMAERIEKDIETMMKG